MLSGEELYKQYKNGVKTGIFPLFLPEEWMCLYTYLSQQNDEDAFKVLEQAIQEHPHYCPLLVQKVKLDLFDGFFDEAFALLSGELANAPDGDVKPLWIDYYFSTGEDDQAKELLDKLFTEKPDYLETTLEYIIPVFRDADDLDRIDYSRYMQRAAETFPRNHLLLEEWRDELKDEIRMEEAVKVCNQLIDLEPYSFDYWDDLARLYTVLRRYEQAIDAFDFALTINGSESQEVTQAKILKGYCLYMNGSYEKAVELYKEFQGDACNEVTVNAFVSHCHVHMKNYKEAYTMLLELIKHDELDSYTFSVHDFVICCVALNKHEEAYQTLKEAVNKRPLDARLLLMFSLLGIWNENKIDEIKQILDRSMALLNPTVNDPSIIAKCYKLLEIGKSYLEAGDKENALVYFDLILRIHPEMEELKKPLEEIFEDEENPKIAQANHMMSLITLGEATEEELAEYLCREDYQDAIDEDNCKQELIKKFFDDDESNN